MPRIPGFDAYTAGELFTDLHASANQIAQQLKEPHQGGSPHIQINLGVTEQVVRLPFKPSDDFTEGAVSIVYDHLGTVPDEYLFPARNSGLQDTMISVATAPAHGPREEDGAREAETPLAIGGFRIRDRYPTYRMLQHPRTGLVVCRLGKTGISAQAAGENQIAGKTAVDPLEGIASLSPVDQARMLAVAQAIQRRIDILERVMRYKRAPSYEGATVALRWLADENTADLTYEVTQKSMAAQ